jgi:NADPH-dependent ferric siderophore reductase
MASPSAAPASRRARPAHRLTVLRSERLTPHLVRVVLGGPGVAGIADNGWTDRYVKLAFRRPGVTYPEPLDVAAVRETMPREDWPVMRTYTIRSLDHEAGEMVIDFVVHGDTGVAGPWALAAQPGDELVLQGPGGAYAPAADADAHVLIGDEAALPAIAAACERIAPGVPVHVFVEVDGPDDELALESTGALSLRWVHRDAGEELLDVVRAASWPQGRVQAFVHGETSEMKALRGLLRDEIGVERELLSISGYWRRGMDEESFQADKKAGNGVAP